MVFSILHIWYTMVYYSIPFSGPLLIRNLYWGWQRARAVDDPQSLVYLDQSSNSHSLTARSCIRKYPSFTREDGGNCCKTDSGGSRASRKVETSFKSFTKILFWALLSNKSTCLQFPISCFLLLMVSLLHLYSILMFIVNSVILSIHGHGLDIFVGSNQNFTTGRSWAARQASACMSCRFVFFFMKKSIKI